MAPGSQAPAALLFRFNQQLFFLHTKYKVVGPACIQGLQGQHAEHGESDVPAFALHASRRVLGLCWRLATGDRQGLGSNADTVKNTQTDNVIR
jgi:hypothetical protein